jgi:hypothetical protein
MIDIPTSQRCIGRSVSLSEGMMIDQPSRRGPQLCRVPLVQRGAMQMFVDMLAR